MRTSKFINKTFDHNWVCKHCGVASVNPAYYKGTRIRTRTAGHRHYYYLFVRETSDGKFDKMIRLTDNQATKVFRGEKTVEYYSDKKENLVHPDILNKIGYYFI